MLDVSMDDVLLVAIVDSLDNLLKEFAADPNERERERERERESLVSIEAERERATNNNIPSSRFTDTTFGQDVLEQLSTTCQFHHNVQPARSLHVLDMEREGEQKACRHDR